MTASRPKDDRASLGTFGEQVAADFLVRRGATVVARNIEIGNGELDLLVEVGTEATVVEVRTARRDDVVADLFPYAKERQVRRLAASLEPPVFRVDLVTVLVADGGVRVRWHPQV